MDSNVVQRGIRRVILTTLVVLVATPLTAVATVGAATSVRAAGAIDMSGVATSSLDAAVVDRLVFHTPLARFRVERSRARRFHRWLITGSDGCSAPLVGSSGRSFNFRLACERHDFAYANYSLMHARGAGPEWSSALRAAVDDQFQRDMQYLCARRVRTQRLRCDLWAVVFFHTVRIAAGP
jgi:hypothetical protein